jgi:hypothetical protein
VRKAQSKYRRQVFPAIATLDSMRTPEHGAAVPVAPTSLAPVERDELAALLAESASISPAKKRRKNERGR